MHLSRPVNGEMKQCRILRRVDGWFAQFVVEIEGQLLPANHHGVGIDVGVEKFAALSNSEFIENLTFYKKAQKELRRTQRRVVRRKKDSQRRQKAVIPLGKVHQRIANERLNFLHQESRKLVHRFGLMAFENPRIRALSRRVAVGVDDSYTSQTCPRCGEIKKKTLGERVHRCDCEFTRHRDTAAALVILGRTAPFGANVGEPIPCVA